MARDADYIKLITSTRWRELRRQILNAHPLCARCEQEGRVRAATEVHHVHPVEDGFSRLDKETLMFDPTNLLPLCHGCHVRIHTELGRGGKELQRRRNDQKVARIRRAFFD